VSIHYSRISFPNPGVPLGWAFCFYFILRGLRTRRPNDFVWAGLAAGFSMYAHYSTRLLPFVVLAFFGYMLLFHFKVFREHGGHYFDAWRGRAALAMATTRLVPGAAVGRERDVSHLAG